MKLLIQIGAFVVCCLFIQQCTGLMCYFCQDTSSAEKKNACQTWVKTMKYYRRTYNEKGSFSTDKYVKNCSNYANNDDENVYCMVAKIESRGEIRSFIRDCSNGKDFFTEDLDSRFYGKVLGDNQTSCIYTGTSDLACVTLCKDGHFCNGPTINGTNRTVYSMALLYLMCFVNLIVARFRPS